MHSKDTVIQTILEQNKALLEQGKAVVDGLRENKLVMEEIKVCIIFKQCKVLDNVCPSGLSNYWCCYAIYALG